jgi:hypothetical protein
MAVMNPTSFLDFSARTPTCQSRTKWGGLRALDVRGLKSVQGSERGVGGGKGIGRNSPVKKGDRVIEAKHIIIILHIVFEQQVVNVRHLHTSASQKNLSRFNFVAGWLNFAKIWPNLHFIVDIACAPNESRRKVERFLANKFIHALNRASGFRTL